MTSSHPSLGLCVFFLSFRLARSCASQEASGDSLRRRRRIPEAGVGAPHAGSALRGGSAARGGDLCPGRPLCGVPRPRPVCLRHLRVTTDSRGGRKQTKRRDGRTARRHHTGIYTRGAFALDSCSATPRRTLHRGRASPAAACATHRPPLASAPNPKQRFRVASMVRDPSIVSPSLTHWCVHWGGVIHVMTNTDRIEVHALEHLSTG